MIPEAHCESCGKPTNVPCTCCGECAWNWNRSGGKKAINRRRKIYGLPPLKEEK